MSEFSPLSAETSGMELAVTKSRISGWRRNRRSAQSLLPAVRAVDGGFRGVSKWGQNRRGAITSAVVIPESLHPQEKSRGHAPERSSF